MFERIGRGWGMAKASWAVIRQHPKLLLLPVFSGIAFIALIAAIGIVPYVLALTVIFTALGTIFRTGTYVYATTGKAPSSMDPELLQAAFRKK